jgi:hypothetical protein
MKRLISFLIALIVGAVIGRLMPQNLIFLFSFILIIVFAQFFTYIDKFGEYYFFVAMGLLIGYLAFFFELYGVNDLLN